MRVCNEYVTTPGMPKSRQAEELTGTSTAIAQHNLMRYPKEHKQSVMDNPPDGTSRIIFPPNSQSDIFQTFCLTCHRMEQMRDHCYLRDRALGNASQLQMAPILYKILKDIGNLLGTRHNFWNSPLTKGILSFGSYERHHVPGHVHKLHHYGSYERQHNDVIQDHDRSESLSRLNHRSTMITIDQSIKGRHTQTCD